MGGLVLKSKQASPGEVPDSCELEQHPALLTAGRLVPSQSSSCPAGAAPGSQQRGVQLLWCSLRGGFWEAFSIDSIRGHASGRQELLPSFS